MKPLILTKQQYPLSERLQSFDLSLYSPVNCLSRDLHAVVVWGGLFDLGNRLLTTHIR